MTEHIKFLAVLSGGAAVAVVGLSQTLAIGALSVTPLGSQALAFGIVAAFVTATVGGLCATLVSRIPGEVSGPRTSISVIYAALCADLVTRGGPGASGGEIIATLSLAVVLMGALQLVAGWARVGEVMKFLPYQVNAGFATGIGLLIAWSQVGPLLGLAGKLSNYDWSELVANLKPGALLIGIATAATVWLAPLATKRVQPLLAGLVCGTALYHAATLVTTPDNLGPTLGTITLLGTFEASVSLVWSGITPSWALQTSLYVLPYAGFLALQGMMNCVLVSVSIAEVTGVRVSVNRALIAQGTANILSGGLAGLPVGTSASQSVVAAKMRDISSMVPAASTIILLVAVLLVGEVLAYVPMVVLAGLLLTTGIGLIDRWTRGLVMRVVRGGESRQEVIWNLAIVLAVAATFFFGSVPLALLVGSVLAMIVLAIGLSAATKFITQEGSRLASTRVWPAEQATWLIALRSSIRVLRPRGGLFFGTAEALTAQLAAVDKPARYCVIDCSNVTVLDATGCQIIASGVRNLAKKGVTTVLAGLDPADPRDAALVDLGLKVPAPERYWFRDLDHALEWVEEELLRERWHAVATDETVELADTQLAGGLSGADLNVLRSHLVPVDLDAGATLFERGAAGDSLYVIVRGLIEIRASSDATGSSRRLAALGPGCIFGDIALITHGPRSAAAVCVRPARLYELKRDALVELEARHPAVYARILTNLNLHLATRLIVATDRLS